MGHFVDVAGIGGFGNVTCVTGSNYQSFLRDLISRNVYVLSSMVMMAYMSEYQESFAASWRMD